MRLYSADLAVRPSLVVANKLDMLQQPEAALQQLAGLRHRPLVCVSALQGTHIPELKAVLRRMVAAPAAAQ